MRLLLFVIDADRYAVPADVVEEVVRAVEVTPLPGAPAVVEGVIDLRGRLVPVFDVRARFSLARREVDLDDHFVIVRAQQRLAALHVDHALDLLEVPAVDVRPIVETGTRAPHVAGAVTLSDGLVLIHDLATFLSASEAESLDAAIDASRNAPR